MDLRVRWSWQSRNHLLAIRQRIRQDKPEAAERVRLQVIEAVRRLGILPRLGRPGRRQATREFAIAQLPYIIVYSVTRSELVVLGIFHISRDEWGTFGDD